MIALVLGRADLDRGPGGRIRFEARSDRPIDRVGAKKIQEGLGYHPDGYDFFGFELFSMEAGYRATWECAASCD